MNRVFAYTMHSRVIWISDKIFQIPVLDDLYHTHLVQNCQKIEIPDCINYTVKHFQKFAQDNLLYTPLQEDSRFNVEINFEKIKCFTRLSDLIQCSYLSSMPIIFNDETDKVEMLSSAIIDLAEASPEEVLKHRSFINSLVQKKKDELKKKYASFVLQIKKVKTLQEVKEIEYALMYEEKYPL